MASVHNTPQAGVQMRERKETPSLFMMRPVSTLTDFEEMWNADDSGSEFEEDSPRDSFDSGMDRSHTTVTSYGVQTPAVEHNSAFDVRIRRQESISTHGPAGPDLFFRTSIDPNNDIVFQMSPIMPKSADLSLDAALTPTPVFAGEPIVDEPLDVDAFRTTEVAHWSSRQVAAWMQDAGFDDTVISRFEENDIDGEVLLALNFEDLKELGIPSFGKRHQIWSELGQLREDGATSPAATAFEDVGRTCSEPGNPPAQPHNTTRRGRLHKSQGSDPIAPADSVSIVAIEQLIPKPHKCSRGERCPKWRKQQRMLQQLDQEYGLTISPTGGGQIFMAGYPEMDVPFTAIELGTLDRDHSQSVPPNMQFRSPVQRRPSSKGAPSWRRPSMMPTLRENVNEQTPLGEISETYVAEYGEDTTHAGWMKKRKARLLRHEWNDHHFRLNGTQLAMHKTDSRHDVRPVEKIDVDQYSIACSSITSDSKLAAAMKSLRIAAGKKGQALDDSAFAFSLVPAAEKQKLMGLLKDGPKSQHFMVTTRDQRIDWMRSIMLAKAVRQKEEGCDVVINGQKL
ncbi:hypothetical protein FH972_021266 [Carpinus fangiana]|uniref:SAM domain-containing protein n=1 Tax=Carpinus fangiana TaxID=176857 RepID=A0A5N6KNV0_9ROSI|nr:hypothetical protein FH972_021266 [Carpinus fangiana]